MQITDLILALMQIMDLMPLRKWRLQYAVTHHKARKLTVQSAVCVSSVKGMVASTL